MTDAHASIRLGYAEVGIKAVRQHLLNEMERLDAPAHYFVVRHADGALYATATAEQASNLDRTVAALEIARDRLIEAGRVHRTAIEFDG